MKIAYLLCLPFGGGLLTVVILAFCKLSGLTLVSDSLKTSNSPSLGSSFAHETALSFHFERSDSPLSTRMLQNSFFPGFTNSVLLVQGNRSKHPNVIIKECRMHSLDNISGTSKQMINNSSERLQCLKRSPFRFQALKRNKLFAWTIQSNVQSLRTDGPSGLPQRCDWVIGTRMGHWRQIPVETAYGDVSLSPQTIFVQVEMLQNFHDHILPCLEQSERFVLITGDDDKTVPRQLDKRYTYRSIRASEKGFFARQPDGGVNYNFRYSTWLSWLNDSRIMHIFVEHLDEKQNSSKVSPIPVGLNPGQLSRAFLHSSVDDILKQFSGSPITSRPLKMRFTNRIRAGPQWKERKETKKECETKWKEYCVSTHAPSGDDFLKEISKYSFLICAHGGGIDPNPNAWSALLTGTIPIIARFPGDTVYDGLPVVLVDVLPSDTLTRRNLQLWRDQLAHMFEGRQRREVVEKLMTDFWWNRVILSSENRSNETSSLCP
mmetsp:Transcript_26854/g.39481  ORF Transcript_26854/g.39481 Transcript_26854/m.39481 type:complete len:490 (+) Transcript_26854:61-1530(+)